MSLLTKLSRILAPVFSLSLLAGYVVYSHQSARLATNNVERSVGADESLPRLMPDGDPLAAALNQNALRHQLQPMISEGLLEGAFPIRESNTLDNAQINGPASKGPFFQTDQPVMMGGTKSGVVSIVFPLRFSRAFQSVPVPDERTWISSEQPNPSGKELMDRLADPVAMKTILADDGTAMAKSGRLWMPDELWRKGRHEEPGTHTSVTVTDYPESGPPAPPYIVPERSVMMASSKSGAVRFVFEFPSSKPSIFPHPFVKDPTAMDSKVVEAIMHDNGTGLAKSGKLLTPEKLWDKFLWHSILMSSSKSGRVFQPPLFDLTKPLLKTDFPIKP